MAGPFVLILSSVLSVPPAAADLKDFDVVKDELLTPHVRYREYHRAQGPVRMFVVAADLKDPATTLVSTLARDRVLGLEGASAQTARAAWPAGASGQGGNPAPAGASAQTSRVPGAGGPSTPLAAINADFFEPSGDPVGVHVLGGELVSSHRRSNPRAVFALTPQEKCLIDVFRLEGSVEGAGKPLKVDAVNEWFTMPKDGKAGPGTGRESCLLVVYTPRYGQATPAVEGVSEAVVEVEGDAVLHPGAPLKGKVREVVKKGGTPIPEGGLVISGAGGARAAVEGLAPGRAVAVTADFAAPRAPRLQDAVGGGPRMLRAGKVSIEGDAALAKALHPRTAVGHDANGRVWLVVVDGRQKDWSNGLTLTELAGLMLELGCRDAMNLDGGGSSTMWVKGEIRNKPSDGRERAVANALAVVEMRQD